MKLVGDVRRKARTRVRYLKHLQSGNVSKTFFQKRKGRNFKFWKMVANEYPYDQIASRHWLLFPKRKVANLADCSIAEHAELAKIKEAVSKSQEFDMMFESLPHNRSISDWFHIHLLKWKGDKKNRAFVRAIIKNIKD